MAHKIYRRTLDAAPELRMQEDPSQPVVLAGYAATFDVPTVLASGPTYRVTEVIRRGAFAHAIANGQDVRLLVDHNPTLILARTKAGNLLLREDETGLYFEATLPNTQTARDLVENIRLGNISQCSFAFIPRPGGETQTTRSEGQVTVTEIELTSLDLYDVSAVTYPAYESTSIDVKSRSEDLARQARLTILRSQQATLDALKGKVR